MASAVKTKAKTSRTSPCRPETMAALGQAAETRQARLEIRPVKRREAVDADDDDVARVRLGKTGGGSADEQKGKAQGSHGCRLFHPRSSATVQPCLAAIAERGTLPAGEGRVVYPTSRKNDKAVDQNHGGDP